MATFKIHEDSEEEVANESMPMKKIKVFHEPKNKSKCFKKRNVLQPINVGADKWCNGQVLPSIEITSKNECPEKPTFYKCYEEEEDKEQNMWSDLSKTSFQMDVVLEKSQLLNEIESVSKMVKTDRCKDFTELTSLIVYEEYEDSIWTHLKTREIEVQRVKPEYMIFQKNLNWNMRSILLDWLVSVSEVYEMTTQTIHLTINYIDRFLSYVSVVKEKLQLVGVASMMIAGKVEEVYPPGIKEWSFLTQDSFTIQQILKMEKLVLKFLKFDVTPPTILDFIKYLSYKNSIDKKTAHLAMYLTELSLLEGKEYLSYLPSRMAAASLALAQFTLLKGDSWCTSTEKAFGYSIKQLSPIMERQRRTFNDSSIKETQAVRTKYKSKRYFEVAKLSPMNEFVSFKCAND